MCSACEIQAMLSANVGTEGNQHGLQENMLYLGFGDEK
jgi:hypothetical protein